MAWKANLFLQGKLNNKGFSCLTFDAYNEYDVRWTNNTGLLSSTSEEKYILDAIHLGHLRK